MKKVNNIDTTVNYLDFEILNKQMEYLEKLGDPNTMEAKLTAKYSKMSLNEFLNHTGRQRDDE